MRAYLYSVMTDRNRSLPARLAALILSGASGVYLLAIAFRKALYRMGVFKSHKVRATVVSIGNLTLGGTGKTPFAIMLAKVLRETMKKSPAVLIRGYGWDEQAMMKRSLGALPLVVGRDRVRGARDAIQRHGADTILLDDGFQHWRIARDLDIVLVDTRNPFGNRRLFPRGILREPLASIKRADIIVLTKTDRSLVDKEAIKGCLRGFKEDLVFVEAAHVPAHVWDLKTKEVFGLDRIKGKRACLVSGIADPFYFEETVKALGAVVAGRLFYADHHNYSESDVRTIFERAREADCIVTTEKDAIKFERLALASESAVPLYAVHIEMTIRKGAEEFFVRLNSVSGRKVPQ